MKGKVLVNNRSGRSRKANAQPGETNGQTRLPKTITLGGRTFKTDSHFASLLLPPTKQERTQLEQNIVKDRLIHDKLVLWKKRNVLVDGYNRVAIWLDHKDEIKGEFIEMDFANRGEVENWIVQKQLGRRNLSGHQQSYFLGKLYQSTKGTHGGRRTKRDSSAQNEHLSEKTSEKLAEKFGVSPATIRRDAAFAKGVDIVIDHCGDKARDLLLAKESTLTYDEIGKLATLKPAEQRRMLKAIGKGDSFTDASKSLNITLPERAKRRDSAPEPEPATDKDETTRVNLFDDDSESETDNNLAEVPHGNPFGDEPIAETETPTDTATASDTVVEDAPVDREAAPATQPDSSDNPPQDEPADAPPDTSLGNGAETQTLASDGNIGKPDTLQPADLAASDASPATSTNELLAAGDEPRTPDSDSKAPAPDTGWVANMTHTLQNVREVLKEQRRILEEVGQSGEMEIYTELDEIATLVKQMIALV